MIRKFVIAPDSFKESISAPEAALAIARGIRRVFPDAEIDLCPIADGGEGTVEALVAATAGKKIISRVTGPLGGRVDATWALLGVPEGKGVKCAVIEMAAASGLPLVPIDQRDPTKTTTFGTGQLIADALDTAAVKVILGIGGSATTDGGAGAAQALGYRFINRQGNVIEQPMTGGLLADIATIDSDNIDPWLRHVRFVVACDVTNPLTGPNGSAAIYGPQKGATPAQVKQLDDNLAHLAQVIKRDLGYDVSSFPGGGAAGGLGAGAMAFFNATLNPGINLVLEAVGFDRRIKSADACLTGEGRIDGQSLAGKACIGVANAAAKRGVKTWALVGSAGPGAEKAIEAGLAGYMVIGEGLSKEESMRRAGELLETAAAKWASDFKGA